MKKLIFIGLLLLFNACGDTQEVLMIKGGTLASCPSKTIEQMVDGYMDLPIWEDLIAEDEKKYVNISGGIMYADKPVEAALQFKINQDETFEYNATSYEIMQNSISIIQYHTLTNTYISCLFRIPLVLSVEPVTMLLSVTVHWNVKLSSAWRRRTLLFSESMRGHCP